jgi:hypothetical protein
MKKSSIGRWKAVECNGIIEVKRLVVLPGRISHWETICDCYATDGDGRDAMQNARRIAKALNNMDMGILSSRRI